MDCSPSDRRTFEGERDVVSSVLVSDTLRKRLAFRNLRLSLENLEWKECDIRMGLLPFGVNLPVVFAEEHLN